ncbi:uncharacterized protein BDR25DRAFT_259845 [Lindgomyces ingoldianus]|uniref:Uncharacterized protein n=1 Tax=Lindgomyces ingoldianus TaxID=673940 RepID=A0ACB6QZ62_9PLEO|nr:uncharacterized protein BDR25DRAFT_259845 [Lindgomyces ingoldianus]KAF2472289.1 hypothetical protein BDR25DRAFT_259845 [Lindgomyces ingoldianus]
MEDTTMLDDEHLLFHGVIFTIIPNSLSEDRQRQLRNEVVENGARVVPFNAANGRIEKLPDITHIISTTSDFPDYHQALEQFKHVVKPSWVDACVKVGKMKNPRAYSPDPALFMSEVIICCAKSIPEGDKEAIAGGVLAMGGQYTTALSKFVTHLIALDMEDERVQVAVDKRLRCNIVLPHWFDDCLKVGRRISERPYTLPSPEILDIEAGAIPPTRVSPHIRDATTPVPTKDPAPPTSPAESKSSRKIRAFSGKKVMLGEDLQLNDRLKGVIEGLIIAGGGQMITSVEEAEIYVCNFRDGPDYVRASQAGKDVGNLSWLYYLVTYDAWTNPMRRMMHYPRPREGIPGFENFKISISSYTGEARVYLENLVKASGATFTKTFKQENTHLITAHMQSEKCDAAQEWGVNVVNHLWLEECYSKNKHQALTDPRYNFFPARTNLGEILGQTEMDRTAIEKIFFPKARKPKAGKAAAQQDGVPGSSIPNRVSSDPVARSSPLVEKTRRTRTGPEISTPSAARRIDGKENETPGTTGSRGAKDRALTKLHDSAPDIAKFEKEMKRKGGVIHGGRREKDAETEKAKKTKGRDSTASKRSIDEVDGEDEPTEDEIEEPAKKSKKAKKDKLTPIKYRMLVSKNERWINNQELEANDKAKMREIGLFITDDVRKVDLLCAPKVVRTKKFVCAMACAPTLVGTSYLDYALKHNKLPPPEKHLLADRGFEKTHGFRLDEALERAKQNQKHLLKNWTIFVSDSISGGFETWRDIITSNGGSAQLYKGRTTNITASKRSIDPPIEGEVSQNQEEDEGDVLYLVSEGVKKEFPLWTKFRELAGKHDMVPRIVKTEWLLFVAMAQYVHWDKGWELNEEVVNAGK